MRISRVARGKMAITHVTLRPEIVLKAEKAPAPGVLAALHEKAHEACFIANSVNTEISVEPDVVRLTTD